MKLVEPITAAYLLALRILAGVAAMLVAALIASAPPFALVYAAHVGSIWYLAPAVLSLPVTAVLFMEVTGRGPIHWVMMKFVLA